MKKETISTFNEGLNYDLNPLTTPDNLLTDCINGTFVTFNGDELALQTDLGNKPLTKLSDGFYPIGIKEYGGVIYIVSAKKPDFEPVEFSNSNTYNKGRVVYVLIGGVKTYYESLENNNSYSPEIGTNEYWLYVGGETEFINKYGKIEFGSYPSINGNESSEELDGIDYAFDSAENPLDLLEKPKLILKDFRAGAYIKFNEVVPESELELISYNSYSYSDAFGTMIRENTVRKIYKVSILQKISNSFRDLTEEIWTQYARFLRYTENLENFNLTGHSRSWLIDKDFKFYCPDNFSGDLFIVTRLEPLNKFAVNYVNAEKGKTTIKLDFKIVYENESSWNPQSCPLSVNILISLGNIENDRALSFTKTINSEGIATIDLPLSYSGKTVNYTVRPVFTYDTCTVVPYEELPLDFVLTHSVFGTKSVIFSTYGYKLLEDYSSAECEGTAQTFKSFNVVDRNNNYIGPDWESSEKAYKFCLLGSDEAEVSESEETLLGTYEISEHGNPYRIVLTSAFQEFSSFFVTELQTKNAKIFDSDECTFFKLTISTNKLLINSDYSVECPFEVFQKNDLITLQHIITENVYICYVKKNIEFHIKPTSKAISFGFDPDVIYYYSSSIAEDTVLNYAMVTNIFKIVNISDEIPDTFDYSLSVNMNTLNFGNTPIAASSYSLSWKNPDSGPLLTPVELAPNYSDYFLENYDLPNAVFVIKFNAGLSSTVDYCNLGTLNVDYVVKQNNHIFRKTHNR